MLPGDGKAGKAGTLGTVGRTALRAVLTTVRHLTTMRVPRLVARLLNDVVPWAP